MARHRIHNSRAGRSSGGGSSWISYSDMMAALLLVFVLMLCMSLFQYYTMLDTKTQELDSALATVSSQQTELETQRTTLASQQTELESQRTALADQQVKLDEANANLALREAELETQSQQLADKQVELDDANANLATREAELAAAQALLKSKQDELDEATTLLAAQQDALALQTSRIDALVGVRSEIITALSTALTAADLHATVDPKDGSIMLDSAVFFETNRSVIKEEGKQLLDAFVPVYLNVLLQSDYSDYLGEIIIEGHTDTSGSYMSNLKLSQNRALTVAQYVLEMPSLTHQQRELLKRILTATGRSSSDPVYNADGTENMEASRRVEFKFSLRDAEMIDEMNRLLSGESFYGVVDDE